MNIEQGIMNFEVRCSIINILKKRLSAAIPHVIIRNFLFDILRFAVPPRVVSHEDLTSQLPDTPGPDLTLYEFGRLNIIGISCNEQSLSDILHQGGPKPDGKPKICSIAT